MSDDSVRMAQIHGVGAAIPEKILSNEDISQRVKTNHAWIMERTGIGSRRISDLRNPQETNVGLALRASRQALERAACSAEEVDLIVYATATPLGTVPAQACRLQGLLGASRAFAFDINAACSGFIYGLSIADQYLRSGAARTALVVGAEILSNYVDWTDRGTCILFGDGAGAALLRASDPSRDSANPRGILHCELRSEGRYAELIETGGLMVDDEAHPMGARFKSGNITMRGNEVFKLASKTMADLGAKALARAGCRVEDLDWIVPHQANLRILRSVAEHLGVPENKIALNLERYGNTSAASIPIALEEAVQTGQLKPGQLALFLAFGAGVTSASCLVRW